MELRDRKRRRAVDAAEQPRSRRRAWPAHREAARQGFVFRRARTVGQNGQVCRCRTVDDWVPAVRRARARTARRQAVQGRPGGQPGEAAQRSGVTR